MENILSNLSYGLYAIGVYDNVRPTGCIVNTLFQVTSENPIVALSLNKNNYTYEIISRTKRFSAAILSEESDPGIIKALGYVSGRDNNKFSGLSEYSIVSELPVITGNTCGALLCEVLQIQDAETHVVVMARVTDAIQGNNFTPMTYKYFQEVIKGRSPKNAPTYNPESTSEEAVLPEKTESYVCKICGYVYNGDLNDEPDDYTCPICGVSKNDFIKQ